MLINSNAPVAQLDSASVFGTEGYRFESYRVCLLFLKIDTRCQRSCQRMAAFQHRNSFRSRFRVAPFSRNRKDNPVPHFPKPFFRASRKLWYVQLNGRQINLGRDKDEAFKKFTNFLPLLSRPQRPSLYQMKCWSCNSATSFLVGLKSTVPPQPTDGTCRGFNHLFQLTLS